MFTLVTGTGDAAMDVLAFPGSDISGSNSSPPLVYCGHHPQLGGAVYLSALHVVQAVHTIAPVLTKDQKAHIAANIGALTPGEAEELLAENVRLAGQLENLKANMVVPLAEVIDLVAEREKRRPVALVEPVA